MRRLRPSVILLALLGSPAWAASCSVELAASDRMAYSANLIEVSRSCAEFTVNLRHEGHLESTLMGHNWVLVRADQQQAAANAGLLAGMTHGFVRPGDPAVIAATPVLGGGEAASVSFPVSRLEAGGQYLFFCSFPGHAALMRGVLRLVD